MKSEKIFEAVGLISDEKITEADTVKTKAKLSWQKMTGLAVACFALIAVVAVMIPLLGENTENPLVTDVPPLVLPPPQFDEDNLPVLNIEFEFGAMGFEAYMAYDISELGNGNPWVIENDLTSMPVFSNKAPRNEIGQPARILSYDEMTEKALEIAAALGIEPTSVYTEPTQEQIDRLMQRTDGMTEKEIDEMLEWNTTPKAFAVFSGGKIEIASDSRVTVWFEPSVALPQGYSFTYSNTTEEQAREATAYLLSEYGTLAGIANPGFNLQSSYSYYGEASRIYYTAFENNGSLTDKVLNYNFHNITFSPDENGRLWIIRYNREDLSELIGYYPIITAEKAQELLLDGYYLTTVPADYSMGEVASVELMYRAGGKEQVYMPYYKFVVDLPEMAEIEGRNGLRTFGVFYVPAVNGEYLNDLPV